MPKQLIDAILKTIILTPGIYGLTQIDFSKNNFLLNEKDWHKSLSIKVNESNQYDLSIAIIVKKELNAKNVVMELDSSIQNILVKQEVVLKNLNIYIRGMK